MPEPVSKAVYQTVINLLTVLANRGDTEAIEALQRTDQLAAEFDLVEDNQDHGEILMETIEGEYFVTRHGASFMPKQP